MVDVHHKLLVLLAFLGTLALLATAPGCSGTSWRDELTPLGSGRIPDANGCPEGQTATAATENHCCWPYQRWNAEKRECAGDARCPGGTVWDGNACRSADVALPLLERGCVDEDDPVACRYLGSLYYLGLEVPKDVSRAQELLQDPCERGELDACFTLSKIDYSEEGMSERVIETWDDLCGRGHTDSCAAAASALMFPPNQTPTLEQSERGFAIADGACTSATDPACTLKGLGQFLGRGTDTDLDAGRQTLQESCEAGNPSACFSLGSVDLEEAGSDRSATVAAVAWIERGCEGGFMQSCSTLGYLHTNGTGVALDADRAAELFALSCTYRDPDGCISLAAVHRTGDSVDKNIDIAIEAYTTACNERGYACLQLGEIYRNGEGVEVDLEAATLWYDKAIAMGDGRGAVLLGFLAETALDLEGAAASYRKGCTEMDHPGSCARLGAMILDAMIEGDELEAAAMVSRACDAGDGFGCSVKAMLVEGGRAGYDADPEAAVTLYRESCEAGVHRACAMLAHHLAAGITVPRDVATARKYFEQACDEGIPIGCDGLADFYFRGTGAKRDTDKAIQLYEKACAGGLARGCMNLALMRLRTGDEAAVAKGLEELEAQCADNAARCVLVGNVYLGGVGVDPQFDKATAHFTRACDNGVVDGCARLGDMASEGHGQTPDDDAAVARYQQSCDAGSQLGCGGLGMHLVTGRGIAKDIERGMTLMEQACIQRDAVACFHLGVSLLDPKVGPKDTWRARVSFAAGCDAGHAASCENLANMAIDGSGGQRDLISAGEALEIACLYDPGAAEACDRREALRKAGVIDTSDPRELIAATVEACESANVSLACVDGGLLLLESGSAAEATRGAELLEKACDASEHQGCVGLAMLKLDGQVLPEDTAGALKLLQRTCKAESPEGCLVLGGLLMEGPKDIAKDTKKGTAALLEACDQELGQGCYEAATYTREGGDLETAATLYDKACRFGTPDGCFARGHMYIQLDGDDGLVAAFQAYARTCDMQLGAGCYNAGIMKLEGQGVDRNDVTALGFFQAGCRFGDSKSCNAYGALRAQGAGAPADLREAGAAFEAACGLGDLAGCDNLGLVLAELSNGEYDGLQDAVKVFASACDAGFGPSCYNLGMLHMNGPDALRNEPLAKQHLERACALGVAEACN